MKRLAKVQRMLMSVGVLCLGLLLTAVTQAASSVSCPPLSTGEHEPEVATRPEITIERPGERVVFEESTRQEQVVVEGGERERQVRGCARTVSSLQVTVDLQALETAVITAWNQSTAELQAALDDGRAFVAAVRQISLEDVKVAANHALRAAVEQVVAEVRAGGLWLESAWETGRKSLNWLRTARRTRSC